MTTSWYTAADCRLEDFRALAEQKTDPGEYPHAAGIDSNVLIYDAPALANSRDVQAELSRALLDGPGIVVFISAFAADMVDRATDVFFAIVDEQKSAGVSGGDH